MKQHAPIATEIGKIADPVERLLAFIREREAVLQRQKIGTRAALDVRDGREVWTQDPILYEFRFCNVRREDDRVTRWIADNWRTPHKDDPDLWFAMVLARFINWPETLEAVGYPVPWSRHNFVSAVQERRRQGLKVYTGAYMVRAEPGRPGQGKEIYQADVVFGPMWEARERLRPRGPFTPPYGTPEARDTLNSYHMLLGQFHGLGSFMAAQIVADLKYVSPLRDASDWWTFAASGPGSRRGLNRALGRPVNSPWSEEDWRTTRHREVDLKVYNIFGEYNLLHAQDIQNCLCEFDKYERARLGEGRPRARYVSHG